MITIGIDFGTTTISGAVLKTETAGAEIAGADAAGAGAAGEDAAGAAFPAARLLHAENIPGSAFLPPDVPGARIQDAAQILRSGRMLLDRLISFCESEGSGAPAAIGLTGQMHGIVYTDRTGAPVSPLYTWQDPRGEEVRTEILQKTGLSVPPGYGLATHLYNRIHGLVPAGAVSLCTIMDLFGMHITGNSRPEMHMTNAASLGFFDVGHGRFPEDRLQAVFSSCTDSAAGPSLLIPCFSEEIRVTGRYRGIPVTTAIGDNQAGFLASVGTALNTPLVNFGTGGQVSMLTNHYSEIPGIEVRPFLPGLYLMAGSSLCGGRAYAVLEQFFRSYAAEAGAPDVSQYALMNRLAEEALRKELSEALTENMIPASGECAPTVTVSPLFSGTREDPTVRGSVKGISEDNFTPGALILGTLRGMAEELYGYYQRMCSARPGSGRPEQLAGSGNGLRKNPVLQKLVAERFGAPLKLSAFEEEAACGAAVSAAMAVR